MIESHLDVGGAVVFWTAAEFTDRSRLLAGLTGLGLANYVPEPRPAASITVDPENWTTSRTPLRGVATVVVQGGCE